MFLKIITKFFILILFLFFGITSPIYAKSMPPSEHELSKQFLREIRANFTLIDDPIINDYIQNLGQRLINHSKNPNQRFHFFVVEDPNINAFAGPDGYVGVNSGLILATNTEHELASVLAHESSHVIQKHILRGMQQAESMALPQLAAIAAAIALGSVASRSGSNGNLGSGAMMAAMAGASQYETNMTRSYEKEADSVGMQTLYKSGFDPNAMASFFERLAKSSLGAGSNIPPILLDHPATPDRIADAKGRAAQYPKKNYTESINYYLAKTRLQALTSENSYQSAKNFQRAFNTPNPKRATAAKYGYALTLMRNFKYKEAENILQSLSAANPEEIIYPLTLAELKMATNNTRAEFAISQNLLHQYPDSYPVIIQYASALLDSKQYASAENFLKAQTENQDDDILIYEMLSQAQAKNGHLSDAYRSRAKIYMLLGYDSEARIQLEQAKKF